MHYAPPDRHAPDSRSVATSIDSKSGRSVYLLSAIPLVPELRLVQPTVDAAAADQILVGALLANAALGHHHDPVGVLDRRQPVGDDQRGAPRSQLSQRLLDHLL